ncbi:MAG: ABC transporter permease, partial [Caldimonas sp.]
MSAVLPPIATTGGAAAPRSEGVWRAAWRRLRGDRLGIASLAVVLVFVLMIVLTASGLVARGWQK